jgi:hypothetical protein
MRTYYPGVLMIPVLLILMAAVGLLNSLGIIHFAGVWNFWPVTLIATGLEELYLWAATKEIR